MLSKNNTLGSYFIVGFNNFPILSNKRLLFNKILDKYGLKYIIKLNIVYFKDIFMDNYYKLLGISSNASIDEIQKAIALNKNNIDASTLAKISLELGSPDNKQKYDDKLFNRVSNIENTSSSMSKNDIKESNSNLDASDTRDKDTNKDKQDNDFNLNKASLEKDANKQDIDRNFDIHQNDYILKINSYGFLVLAILSFFVNLFENPYLETLTLLEGVTLLLSLTYFIFVVYVIVREYKFLPKIHMNRAFLLALVFIIPVYYAQRNSLTRTLKIETIVTIVAFFINIISRAIF